MRRIHEEKVERWVFTDDELRALRSGKRMKISGTDEFIASGLSSRDETANERGVLVYRNGEVTNRYGDGTAGLSREARRAAEDEETLYTAYDMDIADNWMDVVVDNRGNFVRFAESRITKPSNMLESAIRVMNDALLEDEDLREAEAWKAKDIVFQIMGPESLDEMDAASLARKYKVTGVYNEMGASIDGMPILDGYNGPMFGGMQGGLRVVRYESKKTAAMLGGKDLTESLDEANVPRMWAVLYGDGALYGATDSYQGRSKRYWDFSVREDEAFTIVELERVPEDIAANLIAQGTSDQEYDDGYKAMEAARRYITAVIDTNLEDDKAIQMMHGLRPNQI